MFASASICLTLLLLFQTSFAADWAVLVAGSSGYENYRHQANICHAYQILKSSGMPVDHIITMFYDDAANNSNNPFPGKLFNEPTKAGTPGKDVYAGCNGDYTGADVTPDNFMAIMSGDSSKTHGKKVLKSTKQDRVFVYYADHGADKNILFPGGGWMDDYLVYSMLKQGYQNGLWNQLVWYVEACYAGSVFALYAKEIAKLNIYIATSSNADESAWAAFCPPDDDVVNGKKVGTCLGEVWSSSWMSNTEESDPSETLEAQFQIAASHANSSKPAQHPQQFGDLTITKQTIGSFLGNKFNHVVPSINQKNKVYSIRHQNPSHVASWDVALVVAYHKYLRTGATDFVTQQNNAQNLVRVIEDRKAGDQLFEQLAQRIWNIKSGNKNNRNLTNAPIWTQRFKSTHVACPNDCCRIVLRAFHEQCGGFNDYTVQYSKLFANGCAYNDYQPHTVVMAIENVCHRQ